MFAVGSHALHRGAGEQRSSEEQPSQRYPVGGLFSILPTLSVMMRPIFSLLLCAEIACVCRKSPRLQMVSHWLIKGETLFEV